MAKKFNVTGTCFPTLHYMADTSGKLRQVVAMVEQEDYFIINRPRQYGKTTTLNLIAEALRQTNEYLVFNTSFEGVGDEVFEGEQAFCEMFLSLLRDEMIEYDEKALAGFLSKAMRQAGTLSDLSATITQLALNTPKKLVLLIDEVDKSSNNQLFVSFLAVLRNKYLKRQMKTQKTFHSVVLAGVHDVKSLKLKIRPEGEGKLNSPWNIATDFLVEMSLRPHEIQPMLEDYMKERSVKMDAPAMAERLFYFTSGYPFLVSKLCKLVDERILPQKSTAEWTDEDLEAAVSLLLKESNANFDSLIGNLSNNPDLYRMTFALLLEGEEIPFNLQHPLVNLGVMYGIFGNGGQLRIHNRIYREIIYNYMSLEMQLKVPAVGEYTFQGSYLLKNNALDLEKALLKFQEFMREQYSKRDRDFLERHGRLLFLSFIKPIINAKGHTFNEPQISEEKRLDVTVTFFQHKYIVELKLWRGKVAHDAGLAQLASYLDLQHLEEGYLLIFDHSAVKSWHSEWLEVAGKKVFAAWV